MIDERDWLEFHDGLDAMARDDADDAVMKRLDALAPAIPDGLVMLSLARRLAHDRIDDLAACAPEHLVAGAWDRLEAALPSDASRPVRRKAAPRFSARTWTGLAAAAVVALVFLSGYLIGERRQLQARLDGVLAYEERHEASDDFRSPASLLPTGVRSWTAGELRRVLERLPAGAVLADHDELERLLSSAPALRRRPARRLLSTYAATDGLTVAEALRLLTELSPDQDAKLDIPGLRVSVTPAVLSY